MNDQISLAEFAVIKTINKVTQSLYSIGFFGLREASKDDDSSSQ